MASSNKKVSKSENNNMDYHSDNRTAPKATRKRKEKAAMMIPQLKGNKKEVAKKDHCQEYPPLVAITAVTGEEKSTTEKYPNKSRFIQ